MSIKALIRVTGCLAAAVALAGCDESPAVKKHADQVARQDHLKWSLKTLVDAYEVAGHTNAKWDEPAKAALAEAARLVSRSTVPNEEVAFIISNNCSLAVKAGCDDPMIGYLYVRFCTDQSQSGKAFVDAFCQAAQNMEGSAYPAIRKYYPWMRMAYQVAYTYGYGTNIPPAVDNLDPWGQAERHLLEALADKTIPAEEVYEASHSLLDMWKGDRNHYVSLYEKITSQLTDKRAKEPAALLLKGEAYIEMAWFARGGGYAGTVTADGWKQFAKDLSAAEGALNKAWNLDPYDPRVAVKMLSVELGQSKGRDRMELWFARAMKLDPNDYDACNAKLRYLEPKWYGSAQDMLKFGRQCATNETWGGRVPLILVDAHQAIQSEFTSDSEQAKYWRQPEVWADLKSAFERFFALNPEAIGWYHNYAWYAYQAGQWATFNELVPKLGPMNYSFFGGREKFEEMVAYAKKQAQ